MPVWYAEPWVGGVEAVGRGCTTLPTMTSYEFTDGATAIVRGALDAGCSFFAGYPITPASQILMMMMAELPKVGGIAMQGEDEIASIGMCIGATMAGSRSMTATSGPGISLYSENIGMAIMGEVPLVVVDVQRLGPSTGGATTAAQGDVQFVRWGTGGGYPIIALAPSSIAECYTLTMKAFDLAERFRCPVFLLTDKELNLTRNTVAADAYEQVSVGVRNVAHEGPPYRFQGEASPMELYGNEVVRFTGSSHNEEAVISKDPAVVGALNEHLRDKILRHRDEIEMLVVDEDPDATTLLLSYGVTAGAMRQAVSMARAEGLHVSTVNVQSLWPVPEAGLAAALEGMQRIVVAELNPGQYVREIERIAGGREVVGLQRIDGELITPAQFLELLA
jgi:2-oxoglutarate/2-oxoacid ferredoxin oxidoreductase subunit alpha